MKPCVHVITLQTGRNHMTRSDGQEDSFNKMEDYLRSLLDPNGTVSG
jgi:hypothetical protein